MVDFGDYVSIEQKRYDNKNEMYCHKVIGCFESNCWIDIPVQLPRTEKIHDTSEKVVSCICCGVDETEVFRYRLVDVKVQDRRPKKRVKARKKNGYRTM